MTDPTRRAAIADLYSYGGLAADASELLQRSLKPRSDAMLLDAAGEAGARRGAIVLDAGCREASLPIELAQRFGCRVLGIDLMHTWLPMAAKDVAEAVF